MSIRVFIESFYAEDTILCPFMGIEWDETYEGMRAILKQYAVIDTKITPFVVNVIGSKRQLAFSHRATHPDAPKEHCFFLMDDKKMVKSANHLSKIFQDEFERAS